MAKYIIAHDVGTSGNKAVLVDTDGRVQGKCFEPYRTYYPSVASRVSTSCRWHLSPDCWVYPLYSQW